MSTPLDRISPAAALVGREVIEVDEASGVVRLAFQAQPAFANRHGTVAGGFLAAMLDSSSAAPIHAFLPDEPVVTTELQVRFERPAPLGRILGSGRIAGRSEREIRCEAELADPEGRVVARAAATFRVIRPR